MQVEGARASAGAGQDVRNRDVTRRELHLAVVVEDARVGFRGRCASVGVDVYKRFFSSRVSLRCAASGDRDGAAEVACRGRGAGVGRCGGGRERACKRMQGRHVGAAFPFSECGSGVKGARRAVAARLCSQEQGQESASGTCGLRSACAGGRRRWASACGRRLRPGRWRADSAVSSCRQITGINTRRCNRLYTSIQFQLRAFGAQRNSPKSLRPSAPLPVPVTPSPSPPPPPSGTPPALASATRAQPPCQLPWCSTSPETRPPQCSRPLCGGSARPSL